MSAALTTTSTHEWAVIKEQSTVLIRSGLLPAAIKTPEQALAIILQGRELGIGTMAALQTINVIQGKPTVSPQLMLALINRSGQLEDMRLETGPDGATVTMKRRGRQSYTATFGPREAKAMGLDGKDNYRKQAPTMYQWRAVAQAARAVFPDVVLGIYTPDEMGAEVDAETGEIIDSPASSNGHQTATVPAHDAVDERAELSPEDKAEHSEIDNAIRVVCEDLKYSEEQQATVRRKIAGMSIEQKRDALGKLLDKRARAELRTEIEFIRNVQQWDQGDIERILREETKDPNATMETAPVAALKAIVEKYSEVPF